MKPFFLFFTFFYPTIAYISGTASNKQLELLIDQVYPEITTFLSREQIRVLFQELAVVVRDARTLENIVKAMSNPIINALTAEQRSECWESIQKAQRKFGGFQQLKVIFFHSMDAVQDFMGDAMDKDREDLLAKANGKTENEVLAMIYEVFRQYFNIEFGQKVMNTVKYSMTEEDWIIATDDAAKYLNTVNFNMVY